MGSGARKTLAVSSRDLRAILAVPWIYNLWAVAVGGPRARKEFAERYLELEPGDAVLDIGCGTGSMFTVMPQGVAYTGFDLSKSYIEQAQKRFDGQATFVHGAIGERPALPREGFDLAIATGVLHHLPDVEAAGLFELARDALRNGGRLITSDPVYGEGQGRLAKWIISKDRGQHIRRRLEYEALVPAGFDHLRSDVSHHRLRIPYTHLIMEVRRTG